MIKKIKHMRNEEGFSLIELVVAVGILAILSVVGVVAYSTITENARKTAVDAAAAEVLTGAIAYDSNGDDYTDAEEEWKNSATNDSITVKATKNSTGEICVEAKNTEYNLVSQKGAGCEGSTGGDGGANTIVEELNSVQQMTVEAPGPWGLSLGFTGADNGVIKYRIQIAPENDPGNRTVYNDGGTTGWNPRVSITNANPDLINIVESNGVGNYWVIVEEKMPDDNDWTLTASGKIHITPNAAEVNTIGVYHGWN